MRLVTIDSELLKTLRHLMKLDDLEIRIGPATENQRLDLRQQMVEFLKTKKIHFNKEGLLNLESIPTLDNGDISLSHCKGFQGLIWSTRSAFVGFDIEDIGRISEAIVLRVSDASQLQTAPSHSLLWVAKEAAFKVFSKEQGAKLLSDVRLDQWVPLEKGLYAVRAQYFDHSIFGFAKSASDCYYSGFKS